MCCAYGGDLLKIKTDSKFKVIFVSRAVGGMHTNSCLIIYLQIILHMQVRTHCIYYDYQAIKSLKNSKTVKPIQPGQDENHSSIQNTAVKIESFRVDYVT